VTGVTVIMPSWNQGRWIRQSLASMMGDPAITEILVMDRRSTDATAAVVQGYPLARIVLRDRTVMDAIWDGIERARTEWIVVGFTSDWFEPLAVSVLLAAAERLPRIAYVGAGTIVHEMDGRRRLKLPAPGWLTADDVIDDGQAPGITLLRRSLALQVGWPPLRDDHAIYTGYLLRALTHGWTARRLARPLVHFRRHARSISGNSAHGEAGHAETIEHRRLLATQYAGALTLAQCERLRHPATGYERPWPRMKRRLARWWYAPSQEGTS